jgi:CDP-glucose 4,6-dehydratase
MEKMGLDMTKVDPLFWRNKRVFLTGHTGFKGSWLSLWLQSMGANLCGFALKPSTNPALFALANVGNEMRSIIGDVRDYPSVLQAMTSHKPEIILHMAAQPLVRQSYIDPIETYSTNVMGTVHLFEAIRNIVGVRAVVNVTSDKCYENKERILGYRENEPMGGHDPYSNSKGCSELVTSGYRQSFFANGEIALASARAGNVIGGGDWASDRLVPDILRSFRAGEVACIRNPDSTRPWQHVLEPLSGYLILAERLYLHGQEFAQGWNFGPREEDVMPVSWVVKKIAEEWGHEADWKVDGNPQPHEAKYLSLDISKAKAHLGWSPKWNLSQALSKIIYWQQEWIRGEDMQKVILHQISEHQL